MHRFTVNGEEYVQVGAPLSRRGVHTYKASDFDAYYSSKTSYGTEPTDEMIWIQVQIIVIVFAIVFCIFAIFVYLDENGFYLNK